MNFPRQFQFNLNGITYNALLVEGNASSSATGECCICRQPLRGRPHYVTDPALLQLHADCSQQLLQQLQLQLQQQQRGRGTARSLSFPSYPQQQQYPLYHPPPWSWNSNHWNNGGYHYNSMNPALGPLGRICTGSILAGALWFHAEWLMEVMCKSLSICHSCFP